MGKKPKKRTRMQKVILLASTNANKAKEIESMLGGLVLTPNALSMHDFSPIEDAPSFEGNAWIKANCMLDNLTTQTSLAPRLEGQEVLVVGEDSGLCVAALGGAPGIYSARYASTSESANLGDSAIEGDAANRLALRRALASRGLLASRAHFACYMAFIWLRMAGGRLTEVMRGAVHGLCDGLVAVKERGEGGFGYDRMFYREFGGVTLEDYEIDGEVMESCVVYAADGFSRSYDVKSRDDARLAALGKSLASLSMDEKNAISHRAIALKKLKEALDS